MSDSDWEIPKSLRPKADDFAFDLSHALNSIVGLRCFVPEDAFTANTLGPEREGSGVVISESGLIVTIGYLVTEAETIWINTNDGRAIPGHALAYDQVTGFGLVQALGKLDLPALEFGETGRVRKGTRAILAGFGGAQHSIVTKIVGRRDFAGYWEYALDDAFYTAPAHPFWGGTGLIDKHGKLLGIGSLIIQQGDDEDRQLDMNMVVPIGLLEPILSDLTTYGRANRPPRPWLGLFAHEHDGAVLVAGTSERGPAVRAGVEAGDIILSVGEDEVDSLGDFWRKVWATGNAGVEVPLRVQRERTVMDVFIPSADRTEYLRAPKFH